MLNEWIDWALATIASLDPLARALGAGLAILLETSVLLGLLVPGEVIVLVASTAITTWSDWLGTVCAVILGALAGESAGFAIGHLLGARLVASHLGGWLGRDRIARAETLLTTRGGPAVFASRFLPVLHSLMPLIAGLSGMTYRRFLAWTAPACTVWALTYVSLAAVSTAGYRELSRELQWAGLVFLVVLAAGVLLLHAVQRRLAQRALRRRNSSREHSAP